MQHLLFDITKALVFW